MRAATALADWKRQFPQHPATDSVVATASSQITAATEFPDTVALLLPLSGRSEAFGVAVRDGFIAAYLEQDAATRPHLKIYDVAAESVASAYTRAVAEGAGFVVGPLTKEDVAAVAPLSGGHTPVLALNFLSDSVIPPPRFLSVRAVARRRGAHRRPPRGRRRQAEWSGHRAQQRMGQSRRRRLCRRTVASRRRRARYPALRDRRRWISRTSSNRFCRCAPSRASPPRTAPMPPSCSWRPPPGVARQILPQLKFHYAGDVPVYATSDSFDPDPSANADLDGMMFPDMPWMVATDPVTMQIRDAVRAAWPARTARRDRLYAFGFDAYRLVPVLRSKSAAEAQISGVTGKLHLDAHNRIRRDLDWVQIKNGEPSGL